jgi:hypothetical protein
MTFDKKLAEIARSPELAAVREKLEKLAGSSPADFAQRNDVSFTLGTLVRLMDQYPTPAAE